jgi:hypothetical protein
MFLPSIVFMFLFFTIMVISIILYVFVFYNKFRTSCWFALYIHHAHYLNQSKYGLDHTFLDVVDFNIFRLEIIGLLTIFKLEVVDLLFLKLLYKQFSFYSCVAKNSSTNNRRRFDDYY